VLRIASVCVCVFLAFVFQHAQRSHGITLLSVTCLVLPYYSIPSHKWHDFRKTLLNRKCVLILTATFVSNISPSKKNAASYYHKLA